MQQLAARPRSFERPWSLILYSGEVAPGSQLSRHGPRNLRMFHVSFVKTWARSTVARGCAVLRGSPE
eukprot:1558910-Pyramimonas_sp.AAC.1